MLCTMYVENRYERWRRRRRILYVDIEVSENAPSLQLTLENSHPRLFVA